MILKVLAWQLKPHGVEVNTYNRSQHIQKGNRSHFYNAMNMHRIRECEFIKLSADVQYIIMFSLKE